MNIGDCALSLDNWSRELKVRLLEVTHCQWLYHNIQVHDTAGSIKAAQKKEELQWLIEDQIELGGEGLGEQDRYCTCWI